MAPELKLFQRGLARLLEIEARDEEETDWLEQVRLIALKCHQTFLNFLEAMRPKENATGLSIHQRTGTLSMIEHRLHWSLIARKDAGELRKTIVAGMTLINMMLAM